MRINSSSLWSMPNWAGVEIGPARRSPMAEVCPPQEPATPPGPSAAASCGPNSLEPPAVCSRSGAGRKQYAARPQRGRDPSITGPSQQHRRRHPFLESSPFITDEILHVGGGQSRPLTRRVSEHLMALLHVVPDAGPGGRFSPPPRVAEERDGIAADPRWIAARTAAAIGVARAGLRRAGRKPRTVRRAGRRREHWTDQT
jgi:hypothetical protein